MIYCYTCSSDGGCGHTFDVSRSVSDWSEFVKCPKCGKMAHQDLLAQHGSGDIDSQMREYQFEGSRGTRMYAAAYLKGQEDEMKKKHPGREFRWHNNCWLPVIKNKTDKMKFLRERGYVEF